MPKVVYTAAKGLYQKTGSGVNLGHKLVVDGDTLGGAFFHSVDVSASDVTLTLPSAAEEGDTLIVFVVGEGYDLTLTNAGTVAVTGLTVAKGDSFICCYDGSQWLVSINQQ